jgi:adenylate kinase
VRIVLLGPPGAGKGTQAGRLAGRFHARHISTGDAFRKNVAEGTELGKLAKTFMEAGELVPDDVVVQVVLSTLSEVAEGFLLDGFPRTIPQAEALDEGLAAFGRPLHAALGFALDDEIVVKRIAGRRTCARCQTPHNVEFEPPARPGICDRCGGTLVQRPDDAEDVVRRRLEVYNEATAPLLKYYSERGLLREVAAVGSEEQVFDRAVAALVDLPADGEPDGEGGRG